MLSNLYSNAFSFQEKQAYNGLLDAINNKKASYEVIGLSAESAKKVWTAIKLEKQTFYYPALACHYESTGNGIKYILEYIRIDSARAEKKFSDIIKKIEKSMPSNSSEWDVCKSVFDYIAKNVTYDRSIYQKYLTESNAGTLRPKDFVEKYGQAFSAYGVLTTGVGVCEGISKLFKLICKKLGIDCVCLMATHKQTRGPHMLNAVTIDETPYLVDPTSGLVSEGLPIVDYSLFMVSREIINMYYEIDEVFDNCNDNSLSYYEKNHLVFHTRKALREYLCAYRAYRNDYTVRVQYISDKEKINDDDLREMCQEILSYHHKDNESIPSTTENGFFTGTISK